MIDWDTVRLAVFDVDGTLYNQGALRRVMAMRLLAHCLASRSLSALTLLKSYRQKRESLTVESGLFSEDEFLDKLALEHRMSSGAVNAVVKEWIQVRPLKDLKRFRYPDVEELFTAIRRSGRLVGILSDHPAREKIDALDLKADHILSADDPDVRSLKPDPRGLALIMEMSNASSDTTIMVGDRTDRDGEMAQRADVRSYIRSDRVLQGWTCFSRFAQLQGNLSASAPRVADAAV